jgi:hypothetical protein
MTTNTSSLDLARTYTSYSGVDIKVIMGGTIVGTMQAISYAIQREKAPIYVMGRVDPLAFSRGKRGIAGTMISIMLDQHLIYSDTFQNNKVILDNDEIIATEDTDLNESTDSAGNVTGGYSNPNFAGALGQAGATPFQATNRTASESIADEWGPQTPSYMDQIPPFDTSIVAVNEYGRAAMMRIYGCEILNEGSGFSIDDIVIENQMTYICRTILPWKTVGGWNMGGTDADGNSTATYAPDNAAPITFS